MTEEIVVTNTIQCADCGKVVKVKNYKLPEGKQYKCGKCSQPKNSVSDKEEEHRPMKHIGDYTKREGASRTKQTERKQGPGDFFR